MKNQILWRCFIMVLYLMPPLAHAQSERDSVLYSIETRDGNEFIGHIISQDDQKIELETSNLGVITIKRVDVKAIKAIDHKRLVRGEYWFENPQATRYFWSPTAYGLKPGEGYYQNVWIFFNQVSVGISNNVSVGFGVVPLFLFAGASTPVWVTPKISVPVVKDKFNIGGGALVGTIFGEDNAGFGILYGNVTFGSRDKNLNIGLGWGYTGQDGISDQPTITVSGMIRTGARGYFLTENYFVSLSDDPLVLISAGGRRLIKKVSLDYGLFLPFSNDIDTFVAIPWLGIVVPFGK